MSNSISEAIKAIVLSGGTVKFPWKRGIKSWFSEIKISTINERAFLDGEPFIGLRSRMLDGTLKLDEAVELFVEKAFCKRNLAVAFDGIRRHNLTDKDFENLSDEELKSLVRRYLNEYYKQDFPFMVTK